MEISKKGFSLVALMATVTIMVILMTTIIISGVNSSNNAKKIAFATEITMVEQSVNSYGDRNDGLYPISNNISLDLALLTPKAISQFQDNGETITNNKINLCEIDYSKAELSSLKFGNKKNGENDIYVVSDKTGKVYYAKGYKIGGEIFFGVTEELNNILSYNKDKSTKLSGEAIIFEPSNKEWTNQNITVNIKIPKKLTIVSVTANGTNVPAGTGDTDYNKYLTTMTQNGTIIVNYKENVGDTNTLQAKYEVKNIDKDVPIITVDNNIALTYNNEENILGNMKILTKTDSLSGIKVIKYEGEKVENINAFDYFQINGTKVEEDNIVINKGNFFVTVYVEDNAGNFATVVIPIAN